jgi:glycosyltransferase involved in cell wall biosynthesis
MGGHRMTGAMRVVHVITKGDVGGAQTHVVELAAAQLAAGLSVAVIAGTDGPAIARCRDAGADTAVAPSLGESRSRLWHRHALRDLRAAIAATRPDIVHAHSSNAGLLARIACRRLGVPCVYTAHGWPFQRGAAYAQRVQSLAAELVGGRLGDGVICLTEPEAERARRARVARRDRLWVIPNGLADVAPELVRHDRSDAAPGIVMVARFAPPKQQRELVDVMAGIVDLAWTLTFIGDGPELDEVRAHGRAVLGERVRFLGRRDDVTSVLAEQDIAVLWSRYEGMPISLMEAMRAGLCCVGSDLPGVRMLFGDPPVGVVAADASELAVRLRELLDDGDERTRLGSLARCRFVEAFSAGALERATRAVYDTLLATAPR